MKKSYEKILIEALSKVSTPLIISDDGQKIKVYMTGVIGSGNPDEPNFNAKINPNEFVAAIVKSKSKDLEVYIDSPGGAVIGAEKMTAALSRFSGSKKIIISSYIASAATKLACSFDRVEASSGSIYMIHNSSSSFGGDKHSHSQTARLLSNTDDEMISAYAKKTGLDDKIIIGYMDKETAFTARKALELGFIDAISTNESAMACIDWGITAEVIDIDIDETKEPEQDPEAQKDAEQEEKEVEEGQEAIAHGQEAAQGELVAIDLETETEEKPINTEKQQRSRLMDFIKAGGKLTV